MTTHEQTVHRRFDPAATLYRDSPVHAAGPDLDWVESWLREAGAGAWSALDVGSGPGHLALRLAAHCARVCAADPSAQMLATATEQAARRQVALETCTARADALPLPDGGFDLAATRFSAHHWSQILPSLIELHRVVRPAGHLLLIDVLGQDAPLADTHLQAIELLRDPGHVRNLGAAQWQSALADTGWSVHEFHAWPLRLAFGAWVERMRVPAQRVALLREMQAEAPAEVRRALGIEPDGSFTVRVGLFRAQRR